jgi:uncharacterized membrane-anchored protein YhcB (DUF1043 family)
LYEELIAVISIVVGAAIALLAVHLQSRAEDRRFRIQLRHEDEQRALKGLFDALSREEKDPANWISRISRYLDSFEGALLPDPLHKEMANEYNQIWSHLHKLAPDLYPELTDSEAEFFAAKRDKEYADLPPEEAQRVDVEKYLEITRRRFQARIQGFAKGEVT